MQIFKNIFITVLHILICSNIGNSPLSTLYNVKLLKSLNKYLQLYIIYHFITAWVLGIISLKLSNVRAHIQCLLKQARLCGYPKTLLASTLDNIILTSSQLEINLFPTWEQVEK